MDRIGFQSAVSDMASAISAVPPRREKIPGLGNNYRPWQKSSALAKNPGLKQNFQISPKIRTASGRQQTNPSIPITKKPKELNNHINVKGVKTQILFF
jgi:hypothetical protein